MGNMGLALLVLRRGRTSQGRWYERCQEMSLGVDSRSGDTKVSLLLPVHDVPVGPNPMGF